MRATALPHRSTASIRNAIYYALSIHFTRSKYDGHKMLKAEIESSYLRKNAIRKGAELHHILNTSVYTNSVYGNRFKNKSTILADPSMHRLNKQDNFLNKKHMSILEKYSPTIPSRSNTNISSRASSPYRLSKLRNTQMHNRSYLVTLPSLRSVITEFGEKDKAIKLIGDASFVKYNIKYLKNPAEINKPIQATKMPISAHQNIIKSPIEKEERRLLRAPSLQEYRKAMKDFFVMSSNGVNAYKMLTKSIDGLNDKKHEMDIHLQHKLEKQIKERSIKVEQQRNLLGEHMTNCTSVDIGKPIIRNTQSESR